MSNEGNVTVKIALIGSTMVGKTSLMVKYCKGTFSEDYIATLGVQFLEKTINVKNTPVNLVIWDIGGQKNFMDMLNICCEGAHAMIFMFDLSNVKSLTALRDWYKAAYQCNQTARVFLVGNKFDKYFELPEQERIAITNKAKKFASAIGAPLVYCSNTHSINVKKLFQIVVGSVFGLNLKVEKVDDPSKPVVIF
ncbi:small GTPase [Histomonas meleagridis]|uniref:small GTPase n=1 Tax=Histomonas meleagridis TaxID=135588 RepID=UPI003559AB6F|nr:small GTPase [Histomonas meleagridis]KAH0802117.1 small GTPase [Histomonas meleagridis]